jgi:serine/threonine-protein kinase
MTDGTDPHLRRIGTTLCDKWTLERLIAVGGMAAVYVAVHKIGRRDAVKILRPEAAASRELVERFEQEAHAVNRFRHHGLAEVRDFDRDENGVPFLVMELLEGDSLIERALEHPPSLEDALRYLDEVLDVLAAAHAQGIIHRDIKPDNLFITREGPLKVLDFGIARMNEGSPRSQRTASGMVIGTPEYMSPEQVLGHKIDARADIYSVGATFFWLLARRHVHPASNDMEVMVKTMTERPTPLCVAAPRVPVDVGLVIDRALAFRTDDRYPDAATMQQDVQALRRGEAPPYASLLRDSPPPPPGPEPPEAPVARTPPAAPPLSPAPPAAPQLGSAPPAAFSPAPSATRPPAASQHRPQSTLPLNYVVPAAVQAAGAHAAAVAATSTAPASSAIASALSAPSASPAAPARSATPAAELPRAKEQPANPSSRPPPAKAGAKAIPNNVGQPVAGVPGAAGAEWKALRFIALTALALVALGLAGAWYFGVELGIFPARAGAAGASASPPPSAHVAASASARGAPAVTVPRTPPSGGKPAPASSKGDKKKGN